MKPSEPIAEAAPVQEQPDSSASVVSRSEKKPSPSPQARTAPVETRPIVKPIERMESVQVFERVAPVETVQTVQAAQPVTRQDLKAVTPLPQQTSATTAQPIHEIVPLVSLPVRATGTVVHAPATTAMSAAIESHAITHDARAARETEVVASVPVTHERLVVTQDQPVMSTPATGLEQVRVEMRDFVSRPLIEAKASPAPTRGSELANETLAKPAGPIGKPRNKPAFINLEASPERAASFRWLTEAIKRSEQQRRPVADHEGTTVFRITMRQDGRTVHLLDLSVIESSGYSQVDRAAADLIRRSFPIELTEPLAKSQVRVDQPITIHTN